MSRSQMTNWCDQVSILEGTTVTQRDLDRLEEQADRKLMKFNKDKANFWPWAGSISARAPV